MRTIVRGGGTCHLVEPSPSVARSAAGRLPTFLPGLEPFYRATLVSTVPLRIFDEIREIRRSFETLHETGGWLLADERWPDHIVLATRPGENALYSPTSVQLDLEHAEEIERTYPHLKRRGCWHLHPTGGHIPSETDRRAWARGARSVTGDYWIAVIATPGRSAYHDPELHGWITTDSLCEPLRLEF